MNRTFPIWTLLFALYIHFPPGMAAQSSENQRLAIRGPHPYSLALGFSCGVAAGALEDDGSLILQPNLDMEFRSARGWGIGISIPAAMRLPFLPESRPPALALGDIGAGFDVSARVGDWILGAELTYSYPSGIWDPWEAQGRGLASGSGHASAGASFRAIRLFDPIAAGIRMALETGLGRLELSAPSSGPFSICISAHATEAINGSFAISASVSPRVVWPEGIGAGPGLSPPRFAIGGSISAYISIPAWSLEAGISKNLSEYSSLPTVRFSCARRFEIGARR
ncbi:MAG TPA: hypothetical protein VIO60_11760 [Rectinemataceae bacterium]